MLENYFNVPERKSPFNINPWHISKVFLKKFLEEKDIPVDELKMALRKAVCELKILPVLTGTVIFSMQKESGRPVFIELMR